MADVHIDLRLRPTRVGLLVRPNDIKSILGFMRASSCVWGGMYNPIIPVFDKPPKEWKLEKFETARGTDIAKGYIRFFEPDAYIEAEAGLLEQVGLGSLRHSNHFNVCVGTLEEFLVPQENRDWAETLFGLDILDIIRDLYKSEHRFQMKDEHATFLVRPEADSGLADAIFGVYPQAAEVKHIIENYVRVFGAKEVDASPEVWIKTFKHGATVPLSLTQHGLEKTRFWHHEKIIFVFDPARSVDLIDLWNMRLEPNPIIPIPKQWFIPLLDNIREIIESEYRPIRGNPNGLMHQATIEFGKSISQTEARGIVQALGSDLPASCVSAIHGRSRVWAHPRDGIYPRAERMKLTAETRRIIIAIKESSESYASFQTLAPPFASRYGRSRLRWVNPAMITTYGVSNLAIALPFNTFDKSWPRLGAKLDVPNIGTEGWVFAQQYKNSTEGIRFLSCEEAIRDFLNLRGIEAKLSEPGHIAKQMLEHLGGLSNLRILADKQTVDLLNSMANSVQRKINDQDTIEETFEGRRAAVKIWIDLVAKRKQKNLFAQASLEEFTKRNVIKLGLVTGCPHCQFKNWHGLDKVDYNIACERCLKIYEFPQAGLEPHNRNWEYRVVGPFSVRDYGRGSYSSLLAVRVLQNLATSRASMTFSTAMNLNLEGHEAEVDFIGWYSKEDIGGDKIKEPQLIIGEAKSMGKGDLIKPKDLDQLKVVAKKLPECMIVIAVMREEFTPSEKKRLESFVRWASRPNKQRRPTNPVILLTSHELFMDHDVHATWQKLGGVYKQHSTFQSLKNLYEFAESTQAIHLPGFRRDPSPTRKRAEIDRAKSASQI